MPTLPTKLGERTPLGAPCRHCGSHDTFIELRLDPKPPASYSLAGAQNKVAATAWPWAVCDGCGKTSKGKVG